MKNGSPQTISAIENLSDRAQVEDADADEMKQTEADTSLDSLLHHPLFTRQVILPTRPIAELYSLVRRAVILRDSGICLSASSGVGKTFALEMVEAILAKEFPKLVMYRHDTHNQQIPSIRAFFKHFLTTLGHKEKKGETYDIRERLVDSLVDNARISGLNMIVLSIDEAQAMALQDFNFLKDIYNDLAKSGVQLVTILMGQEPELSRVITGLRNQGRLDLIGRFAMRHFAFRSYNNLDDLIKILMEIDSTVDKSGCEWTKFFFPLAYESGFRLENEGKNFMAAIRSVAPKTSHDDIEFPARQTFAAIRIFVMDNCGYDGANMHIPKSAWCQAVQDAVLQDAMLLMNVPQTGESVSVQI